VTVQQTQQIQQMQQPDGRLSALETRVEGVVGTLQTVLTAISNLNEKIDRGRATPWAVIFSALGVLLSFVVAIGGLAYLPVKTDISDIKTALVSVQDRADRRLEALQSKTVTRDEHEVHWKSQDRDYDFMRDRIGRVEKRLEQRVDRLERSHFKNAD
jgi:hypothetical protein